MSVSPVGDDRLEPYQAQMPFRGALRFGVCPELWLINLEITSDVVMLPPVMLIVRPAFPEAISSVSHFLAVCNSFMQKWAKNGLKMG